MKKIFKYELEITDEQAIELPMFSQILSVQMQGGKLQLWAIVNPNAQKMPVYFRIVGTGHELKFDPEIFNWIATVQDGALVWHIFMVA